jgi:hypothetical protein
LRRAPHRAFEEQLAKEFAFDEDATWKAAHEDPSAAVEAARCAIAERCEQCGIPKWARPELSVTWWERGENASKERRAELRKIVPGQPALMHDLQTERFYQTTEDQRTRSK